MKNVLFLLTALFAFAFTEAKANDGLYLDVFAGPNWLNVDKKHSCSNSTTPRIKATFDTGYVVGGSVGYEFCNNFRFEGEISYRQNKIKKAHFKFHPDWRCIGSGSVEPGFPRLPKLSGTFRSVAFMANVFYDFPFECSCWEGYVGGGLGYVDQKFKTSKHRCRDNSSSSSNSFNCNTTCNADLDLSSSLFKNRKKDDKEHFGAQAILGIAYTFCDNMYFDVEYRFFYAKNHNNNSLVFGLRAGF